MPTRDVTAYWMPRLKRGMTIEGCASAFPRQDLPELLRRSPSKTRGRRECRVRAAPMAACASVESTRVSNQGHTAINRHSLRDGFNGLYRALPGDRALLPPSFADRSTTLASASGRQDHTSLPSADKPTRLVNRRVHRIPLPTSVTTAKRPSCGNGTAGRIHNFWFSESEIFARGQLTIGIRLNRLTKLDFTRTRFFAPRGVRALRHRAKLN